MSSYYTHAELWIHLLSGKLTYICSVSQFPSKVIRLLQGSHLNIILDSIFERACKEGMTENDQACLQSFFLKLLTHFNNLDDILAQVIFLPRFVVAVWFQLVNFIFILHFPSCAVAEFFLTWYARWIVCFKVDDFIGLDNVNCWHISSYCWLAVVWTCNIAEPFHRYLRHDAWELKKHCQYANPYKGHKVCHCLDTLDRCINTNERSETVIEYFLLCCEKWQEKERRKRGREERRIFHFL